MREIVELQARVRRREVLRLLGYPRGRPPSAAVAARFEALWAEACSLACARGAFRLIDRELALTIGVPSPAAEVAAAVCTIGAGLEDRAQSLGDSGDALGALILDAFGSAAAESAAEALQACVCAAVQDRGLSATRRISPGYGSWELARSSELLALLPAASLGISLTEGSMMMPRKSVSFAVTIGAPVQDAASARCAACEMVDCRYRFVHDDAPQEDEDR